MISSEVLRRYPFFSRLSIEQISSLAKLADEETVENGHYFFREDEVSKTFYLVLEGAVAIVFELPERDVEHTISDQFMRKIKTKDVVVSTVGPGDVFGWSGIIPPHKATAGAKAVTPCRVVAFDCEQLIKEFDNDCAFGYLMAQKAAQVISQRLRDMRIESLATFT
jgi:CRP/FNR family transcriptional regulator, cyclic AMP receptor protein